MTRALKTLFLVLALAALPLRGMAAVVMWHCAQGQHDAASASANPHAGHDHVHADSKDDSGQHTHATNDVPAEPALSEEGIVASTCSACAACCMGGTVAPTAWSVFSFAPIGASRIAFVERSFTGIVPAQLERPPLAQTL